MRCIDFIARPKVKCSKSIMDVHCKIEHSSIWQEKDMSGQLAMFSHALPEHYLCLQC